MKKVFFGIFCLLLAVFLMVPSFAAGGEYHWYCKRQKEHRQALCDPEMRFVEELGGYYIDHRHDETCEDKVVYLTFDAGYGNGNVEKILDVLRAEQVTGCFFILDGLIRHSPELVRRMAAEGHQVGNHSYDHAALNQLTPRQALEDLEKNDTLLRQLLGDGDYWVRPPYGLLTETEAAALTVPLVNWSVDTEDWRTKDSGKILDVIYRCTGDGDIVLLHDRYQNTVDAVLTAIEHLQQQGYVFVTVEELLALKGVAAEPGVTYRCA